MAADALAPCVVRTSATIVLNKHDASMLGYFEEWFRKPEYCHFVKNKIKWNYIFLFPKLTSAWKELVIPCHAMICHAHSCPSQATHVPVLDFPMSTTCMSLTLQCGSNFMFKNRLQYWAPFHYKDNLAIYGISFIMIQQASNSCF